MVRFLTDLGSAVKVLDLGCGRGDTVAWLLENGWDAYGADVCDEYIQCGVAYVDGLGRGTGRLQAIRDGGPPFDGEMFDVVLSNQVLEHVRDLEKFAAGVAAVTRRGGHGLHIFPAAHRLIEPHIRAPIVHWLPKGAVRRRAVRTALRVGAAAPYFSELPLEDRAEVFSRFSEEETFYRSEREVGSSFMRHGFTCDFVTPARDKVSVRFPRLPVALSAAVAGVYRRVGSVYLLTTRV